MVDKHTPVEIQRSQAIHRHSFWLYSVIVGLSLEEVLRHVLPHVSEVFKDPQLYMLREIFRLAVFLTLTVRFYLGSVSFFNKHHAGQTIASDNRYTTDFLFGLIHFSAFFGLALSIEAIPAPDHHIWLVPNMFLGWVTFILFYDVIWLTMCRKDTFAHVLPWALINLINLALSIGAYYLVRYGLGGYSVHYQDLWAEFAFLAIVLLFSIFDTLEVFDENPRLARWIAKILDSLGDLAVRFASVFRKKEAVDPQAAVPAPEITHPEMNDYNDKD